MESIAKLREKVEQVLKGQITGYLMDELEETVIQSADLNRFLVVRTGWYRGVNHYALIQDVEVRKNKTVVVYADNTDTDLAEDLTAAGIPVTSIINAHDPDQVQRLNREKPAQQQEALAQRMAA